MTTRPVVVLEVDAADAEDLEGLGVPDADVALARGLDGAEIVSVMVTLTPAAIILIRSWLRARVDQRKVSTVILDGQRLEGYTAPEVVRIIKALERELPSGHDD